MVIAYDKYFRGNLSIRVPGSNADLKTYKHYDLINIVIQQLNSKLKKLFYTT